MYKKTFLDSNLDILESAKESYEFAVNNYKFVNENDFSKLQSSVLSSPKYSYLFAKNVPGADIKKLQESVLPYPVTSAVFAMFVSGADIKELQKSASSNPKASCLFALCVPGADVKLLKSHMDDKYLSKYNQLTMYSKNFNVFDMLRNINHLSEQK